MNRPGSVACLIAISLMFGASEAEASFALSHENIGRERGSRGIDEKDIMYSVSSRQSLKEENHDDDYGKHRDQDDFFDHDIQRLMMSRMVFDHDVWRGGRHKDWHHFVWFFDRDRHDGHNCNNPSSNVPLPGALPLFGFGLAILAGVRASRSKQ